AARQKPGAEAATWLCGTAETAPDAAFDLALMTSHVAQIFVDDAQWARTLKDLHRALVPGGQLAFDSRDPAARGWETWDSGGERERFTLPDGQRLETWTELGRVADDCVTFTGHVHFPATAETVTDQSTLRFRSEAELRRSLTAAGFEVQHIYGGWQRQPVGEGSGKLIVVARKSAVSH
ncbi:methyltransferase domain-containing protein, partial [Deinococcus sp.]|uniref:methyltransferase domain-containing protein n=1 Tax=Deinococcus sp. TaxID=47478 RepID=UPI0025B9A5AA